MLTTGGLCLKGYISTREKCKICQGRLVNNEGRKGCYCSDHPNIKARTFYVKFGKDIYRRFIDYETAARFLTVLRFKHDEGSLDERDYRKENSLGFANQVDKYLGYKAATNISPKTVRAYQSFLTRAVKRWGNRNIKDITDGEIEDLLFDQNWQTPDGKPVSHKTRHNMKSCLHDFWTWAVRRERRSGKDLITMPIFPEISYTLAWRNRIDIETLVAVLSEIKRISWDINPKIWFGINFLTENISVRPGELRMIKEQDINLGSEFILISKPKEGSGDSGKHIPLEKHDIEFIRSMPSGTPDMFFFRHKERRLRIKADDQFGPKYFKTWWDKACANLGIEGVGLYGGTKHTVTTALGEKHTPEEIKRGGTGSRTNKAFDRYFQPLRREKLNIKATILRMKKSGEKTDDCSPQSPGAIPHEGNSQIVTALQGLLDAMPHEAKKLLEALHTGVQKG